MASSTPAPPLLFTKRLTSFLRDHLSTQIHTSLITTISGKLVAHASTLPARLLRNQCTVAASIWSIYASPTTSATVADVSAAVPTGSGSQQNRQKAPDQPPKPATITIQLSSGVFVVRKLKCGLLFVCIGPATGGEFAASGGDVAATSQPSSTQQQQHQESLNPPADPAPILGSPSEVASVKSIGAATTTSIMTTGSTAAAGVVAMRKGAEGLARLLDGKLGNLGVPEDSTAIEFR